MVWLTQTLPDVIPPFVPYQSALGNHPACRKLSDHPKVVLVWISAVMVVRGTQQSSRGSVYRALSAKC
jgi:hypothetical protein